MFQFMKKQLNQDPTLELIRKNVELQSNFNIFLQDMTDKLEKSQLKQFHEAFAPNLDKYQSDTQKIIAQIPYGYKVNDEDLRSQVIDLQLKTESMLKNINKLLEIHHDISKEINEKIFSGIKKSALEDNGYNASGRIELNNDELSKISLQRII